jgi:hypothetical protein
MSNKKQNWKTFHFRLGKTQMVVSAKTRSILEAVRTLRYSCAQNPLVYLPDYNEKANSRSARLQNRKGVKR